MAIKTEHTGGYYGRRKEVKAVSKKLRRKADKEADMRDKRELCLATLPICEDAHQKAMEALGLDPCRTSPSARRDLTEAQKAMWDLGIDAGIDAHILRGMLKIMDEKRATS